MKTKQTCGRCGGSGNYSFNPKDGTVCYGCNGSGFVMVDLAKLAKLEAKRAEKHAAQAARCKAYSEAYRAVIAEFNPVYGPFDVTTELGVDQLNCAIYRATGKGIAKIRDERMAVAA
jgi:hypothetical protein